MRSMVSGSAAFSVIVPTTFGMDNSARKSSQRPIMLTPFIVNVVVSSL